MAIYRLYMRQTGMRRIKKGLAFACDADGELTVFMKGQECFVQHGVELGEMYALYNGPSGCSLEKVKMPQYRDNLLMWMFSYDRENRAITRDKYERVLAAQRKKFEDLPGKREATLEGAGYAFTTFDLGAGNMVRAAAYVDQYLVVTRGLVMKVIKEFKGGILLPREYVYEKILKRRFGLTEEDLRELEAWEQAEGKRIFRSGNWH